MADHSEFTQYTKPEAHSLDELMALHGVFSLEKQFAFGEIIRDHNWQFDMQKGSIAFGPAGEFPVQLIGTLSFNDNSWLWGWANEKSGIPAPLLQEGHALREIGESRDIAHLKEPHFEVPEGFEHIIGSIACGVSGADAYYSANYGKGTLVVTVQHGQFALQEDPQLRIAKMLTTFPRYITMFESDHRLALLSYLIDSGCLIHEASDTELRGLLGDRVITGTFDERGRLANLSA